ncbi:unnamed protein product [Nesidiocoris tenuis]|uniref:Uncharacterized protein n=1 Tax=Nesidiocoris tenuis TaxID=355587 RepID=A0A6H5GH34_9HEMI|nr:unnamed protein product [Nesidiocoris tenuis]
MRVRLLFFSYLSFIVVGGNGNVENLHAVNTYDSGSILRLVFEPQRFQPLPKQYQTQLRVQTQLRDQSQLRGQPQLRVQTQLRDQSQLRVQIQLRDQTQLRDQKAFFVRVNPPINKRLNRHTGYDSQKNVAGMVSIQLHLAPSTPHNRYII